MLDIQSVSQGGWVHWLEKQDFDYELYRVLGAPLMEAPEAEGLAQFTHDGGDTDARLLLRNLVIFENRDSGGISAREVQATRTGQLEGRANTPYLFAMIADSLIPPTNVESSSDFLQWQDSYDVRKWHEARRISTVEMNANVGFLKFDPEYLRLPYAPNKSDRDDEFYEKLAAVYVQAAARERAPVKAMAEYNRIKMTTMKGWITAARRRGILAPGRSGKKN